jgi:hypothetical protein
MDIKRYAITQKRNVALSPEVDRPLFWSTGPLSAAQRTTEMIVDQRTGKKSGPALADYRNGASAIPLICIFGLILKIFQREEIIK